MKSLKFFQKPEMLYLLIGVAVIIVLGALYFSRKQTAEGFYPITDGRLNMGDTAMRRYNDFADTQDMEKVNVIPEMEEGDKMLNALLDTPSYEPDGNKVAKGPGQGLNFNDERKYRALPQVPELLRRIKLCEKVKGWTCEAISDPEFYKYCGICSKDGQDHLGAPHSGGLYIDPDRRKQQKDEEARSGRKAEFVPTFGICKGEYLLERNYCDIQKDRYECSIATSLNDPIAASKCGLCVNGGGFVYVGNRGDKNENYVLKGNAVKHRVLLRLAVTHTANVAITVTRMSDGSNLVGGFIPGSNVYLVDIFNAIENEKFTIRVRYPEWADYQYSAEDNQNMAKLVKPGRASLVRAAYGPNISDHTTDDPRAADVTRYIQDKFKIFDCSKTNVAATNDGLGGDPNPGIYKQLRLAYSDDGVNFAYAYGREGQASQPVMDDNFKALCPPGVEPTDAARDTCEMLPGGTSSSGRTYTDRPLAFYGASGKSKCIMETDKTPRGVVGMWESVQRTVRTVPLDVSVRHLNGLAIKVDDIPKYGTIKGSKDFKKLVPPSKVPGIPQFLFWMWGKNKKDDSCELLVQLPAFLRDPTIAEDIRLCPGGPISTTVEGSTNLQAGVCQKMINGKPQGPGTYTDECIRDIYLESGCTAEGKAFPNSAAKLEAIKKDPTTGEFNDADAIIANATDSLFNPASTGLDAAGAMLDSDVYAQVNMDCFGKIVTSACDTAFKETGPHTPACLDYLFKNAGKDNPSVGATYRGVYNRSSGTDRTAWAPVLYCQRTGSMSPLDKDGKLNLEAIQAANSKGGVPAVREFYRQIHYDANFNMDRNQQKENLQKCYGVDVVDAVKPCPPPPAPPPFTCGAKLLPKAPKLTRGNRIGDLTGLTGNYRLSFDITAKDKVGGWGSLLHFTSDGNNCCGLGQRSPAIWFFPGDTRLHVRIGDAQDGNWGIDTDPIPLNKRTNIELICQDKDVTLRVGTREYKVKQPSRRYAGNLTVFACDPWHDEPKATMDNLCFEILPKLPPNIGNFKFVGDFVDNGRPLPERANNVSNVEDCYKQAKERGKNMFGLQYYGECWVGKDAPYDRGGPWKGDSGELGVGWMNKVYVEKK